MKIQTKTLVTIALLTACSIILRRILTIPLPINFLNFGGFPVILSGLLLGPYAGAITGALSDIVSCIMFPKGPPLPHFTITSMLTGCLAPLFLKLINARKSTSFILLLIAVAIAQGITKMFLVPLFLQMTFGYPFAVSFTKNFLKELTHIPIYAIILHSILLTQKDSYITVVKKELRVSKNIENPV